MTTPLTASGDGRWRASLPEIEKSPTPRGADRQLALAGQGKQSTTRVGDLHSGRDGHPTVPDGAPS
jgi:hypothetical protein